MSDESDNNLLWPGVVVAVAVALRASIVSAGLPAYPNTDEDYVLAHAGAIAGGHLDPHFFDWPGSLQFYATAILIAFFFLLGRASGTFSSLADFKRLFYTERGPFYLLARWLDVTCGVVTVYLVSRVVRPLGTIAVTLAACLVLFSPTHVRNSAYALADVPTAMLMIIAIGLFTRMSRDSTPREYFICGLWIGLATANKYYAMFTFAGVLTAALMAPALSLGNRAKLAVLAGMGVLLGFGVGCPFSLLDYPNFLADLSRQAVHQQSGHIGFEPEGTRFVYFVTRQLVPSVGLPALVLASLGCGLALLTSRYREYRPHLAVLLLFLLVIGNSRVSFDRYAVPLIPLVAVMSALPVSWLADRWKLPAVLISVLAVAVPAAATLAMCSERCKVDIRYPADALLAARGIRGGTVLTTFSGPRVPGAEVLTPFDNQPRGAIVAKVRQRQYSHIVISAFDFDRALAPASKKQHPEVYESFDEIKRNLASGYDILYSVEPDATYGGQAITIYQARDANGRAALPPSP